MSECCLPLMSQDRNGKGSYVVPQCKGLRTDLQATTTSALWFSAECSLVTFVVVVFVVAAACLMNCE